MKNYKVMMSKVEISENWNVGFSLTASKQYKKLKRNGSKPSVADIVDYLAAEIESEGPYRMNWPNYGPLDDNKFHCHLKKGKPTYVACWEIIEKKTKIIKVYYVGTHENAPY